MEYLKRLAIGALLVAALPVVAQQDEGASEGYFSLSSERTFAPSDTPTVQLWAQATGTLQFRVYRVNDEVKFFSQLEDPHRMGASPSRPASERTALETLRAFKRRWRTRARNMVRAQFTSDSRSAIRGFNAPPVETNGNGKKGPAAVNVYANVPLLNQRQLVATWEQPFQPKNRWESATVPVPAKGKGVYVVEATDGKLMAYTVVTVTDLGLIAKSVPGRLLVRAVRRDTGVPAGNCPVTVYSGSKRTLVAETRTAGNGFVEIPFNEDRPENVLVMAKSSDAFAAIALYGGSLGNAEGNRVEGYVYTDRPVYRPGHMVNYRAILRAKLAQGYELPQGREAAVEIQDETGNAVHRARHTLSAMGTISGSFEVPAAAGLGFYGIEVRLGEASSAGSFRVEEYKKPEYEVKVVPTAKRVVQGGKIEARIDARYFFGEPVAGAKVTWVVHRSRYWVPYYLEDLEEEGTEDSVYESREQVSETQGTLDADGKLTVTVPTDQSENDMRYRIEARVTDAAGREIAGVGSVIATIGPYFVHIDSDQYVYKPGDTATLTVEARDYDGNFQPGKRFTVTLEEWNWPDPKGREVSRQEGVTGADGKGQVSMKVSGGSMIARVRSATGEGRAVEDRDYLWISGSYSSGRRADRVQIIPDKSKYAPGETAKLLIVGGEASMDLWVATEGRSVYASHFVTTRDGSVTVEVPIERHYAPNFFVSVTAMRNNKMVYGSKSIKVPPVEHTLNVTLSPSKPEYKPGEPGTYVLEAKDAAGKPVSGEFSVGVVDEAIYSVRSEVQRDIVPFFYGREWNRVSTDNSLSYYFSGSAGKRRMQLARVRPFRPNAQLKPDRMVEPRVRKAFPDTAYWSPTVRTDASGKASVKLEYPDALTTWRATARGVTADTKVGSVIQRVVVRKNLLTRLAVPRFFRQGDTMTVTLIAQNLLATEKKVRVSLEAKGLDVLEGGTQEITVPSKATGAVDYRVRVPASSEAVLLAKALTNEESDALELTIPVIPFGARISDPQGGSFTGAVSKADAAITFPEDADPSSRFIEVSASPSAAASVFEALEYLTAFPYGCTEQTMSSFLPNVIVSQAVKSLNLQAKVDQVQLAVKIRAGLERLAGFQHEDGGWGWWKDDESDLFMTSYVVAGLSQAKAAGVIVDDQSITRGAEWLAQHPGTNQSPDRLAFSLYAQALAKRPLDWNALFNSRDRQSVYGLALLGLALDAGGDARANEIASALEGRAKQSDAEAWWDADRDTLLDIPLDNSPEVTAFVLKLLAKRKPSSPLLPKAALWLVNHRNEGNHWSSTKQTAMVIHGLTDFLKQSGELKPDFSATVYIDDKPAVTRRFTPADAATPALARIPVTGAGHKIRVERNGSGRVYWSARADYYSAKPRTASLGNSELKIEREFHKLVSVNTGGKIVYRMEPLSGPVSQGDILAVRLTVRGSGWRYLLVEDPIPAGTEGIERDDLYEFAAKPAWWTSIFLRREFRDDRVAFFDSYLDDDRNEYVHLIKVVNPGQFRVSPARVEPMYQPRYFATSAAATLEAQR